MGEDDASRAAVSGALAELNNALARAIGPDETAQVAEYIEHHEFGLALELLVSLVIRHGLDGRPHGRAVEALFRTMDMEGSEHAAAWREHLRGA